MSRVEITNDTKPGEVYIADNGEVYKIQSFCTMPTVTMQEVTTGSTTGGGIGCLNLDGFTPLKRLGNDDLIGAVEFLAEKCSNHLTEKLDLKEKIIELKEELFKLKWPDANGS